MRIRQLYRWASARLWAFLPAAVIAVSGCATIESYQQAKMEYDRQTRQNEYLVRQYSEDIRKLNKRQIDYDKTLAHEALLKKKNTRLRQSIAKVESALNGRLAAQQTPPDSAFKELGRIITAQTYELVLKELGDYSNLENLYNRQLKALSSYQNGSPEYIREAEIIRAQALLDVISEAIVTVNIPREALRESTLADDPKLEQALITLANAQDQMLIALNDFKLQGQDQSNSNYSIAQSSCVNMLAAITDLMDSQNSSPLAEDLIMRLKTMHTVTEVAKILLSTTDALMNSSTPLEGGLLVAQSLKGYQPIAQQLSYLIAMRANISAVEIGQPTNSAIRFLNRMEWIMTMSTYCQGDAFKPETYLQMRLGEIRPLKAAVLEVIESYKINKFKNLEVGPSERQTQTLQTQTWRQLADINSDLIEAAGFGYTAKVKQLLKQGADLNAKDKYGETALTAAARFGHTDIMKTLIDAGADVNAKDIPGIVFFRGKESDHKDVVRLLKQTMARRHMIRGQAAAEIAKTPADYEAAIREFKQAAKFAPDWPQIYYNLGVVQKEADKYQEAIGNLKKYLALAPDATDTDAVRDLIYKIEFLKER